MSEEKLIEAIEEALKFIEDPDDEYADIDPDDIAFAVDILKEALNEAK